MERIACFSLSHQEVLNPIKVRLMKYCTSDSLNAFGKRENYFLSLPHDPLTKMSPQKAFASLMCPSEIENLQEEIQELLKKGLIEPSKSAWACIGFYVNKHSEQKRGKMRLVVNYNPLNKALNPIRYPLPNKASLL